MQILIFNKTSPESGIPSVTEWNGEMTDQQVNDSIQKG